jgi:hypothetical protein
VRSDEVSNKQILVVASANHARQADGMHYTFVLIKDGV